MFSLWSRTRKSTPRLAAGDSPTSRTANLATMRCTRPASLVTCLPRVATTFSLNTHLRPEFKQAPIPGGINFSDAARMPRVAAKERQMAQMVADVLVGALEQIGVRQIFGLIGDSLNPLGDAVRRSKIEWIGVRHEEGAALAAAGQAKLTGRLGVCAGTTGPGSTHLVA